MEPLHICIRGGLAWHDEAAVAAALLPFLRPKVELWNATFELPYAGFRVRLARIARENLSRVENAKITLPEALPPGALVVPLDDDDWLSPEIGARLLAEQAGSPQGYHWNRYLLEAPRRPRRFPWARERRWADTSPHTCGSNNYAIRNLPELAMGIQSHTRASAFFDANPGRVKRLDAWLSLQNRTLASRSMLGEGDRPLTRDALIEKFRRYRSLYDRTRLPRELAWAQPSLIAMMELMHELRLK
ncbi:MAG TPA: hypothetical protein VII72_19485 [Myxococcota bacterium]